MRRRSAWCFESLRRTSRGSRTSSVNLAYFVASHLADVGDVHTDGYPAIGVDHFRIDPQVVVSEAGVAQPVAKWELGVDPLPVEIPVAVIVGVHHVEVAAPKRGQLLLEPRERDGELAARIHVAEKDAGNGASTRSSTGRFSSLYGGTPWAKQRVPRTVPRIRPTHTIRFTFMTSPPAVAAGGSLPPSLTFDLEHCVSDSVTKGTPLPRRSLPRSRLPASAD